MKTSIEVKRTMHYAVQRNARLFPQRPALIWGEKRFTWLELHENCNRAGNALLGLGIKKSEKIGCMLRNCNQFMETFVACLEIGASPMNINYRYKEEELRYILENGDTVALVCHPEYEALVQAVRSRLPLLRHVIVVGASQFGNPEWDDLMRDASPAIPVTPWGRGTCTDEILFFTGGTTGMPKGVIWPHENFIQMIANNLAHAAIKNLSLLAQDSRPGQDKLLEMLDLPLRQLKPLRSIYIKLLSHRTFMDRLTTIVEEYGLTPPGLSPLLQRLSHAMGIMIGSPLMHGAAWVAVIAATCAGGTVYFPPDSLHFDPHGLWSMVEKERVRMVLVIGDAFAVPLLEALEERDYNLDSLVCLASGAVKLSPYMKERFHKRFPHAMIVDTLIATEGGGAVAEVSTASEGAHKRRFKVVSTGRFPVMVIDENNQFVIPGSNHIGRLAYGGPQSKGYWKDPKKTAETYLNLDGQTWVMVGDMCTVDADGTINLIGRSSDCINSGGEKIFPYEIENVLMMHPKVREVAVVGVPHPRWGSAAAAVIQLMDGSKEQNGLKEELAHFVHEHLSDYKCPRFWVFVEALERTPAGKLNHKKTRDLAMTRLGLVEGHG